MLTARVVPVGQKTEEELVTSCDTGAKGLGVVPVALCEMHPDFPEACGGRRIQVTRGCVHVPVQLAELPG